MKKSNARNQTEQAGDDTKVSKANGAAQHSTRPSETQDIAQLVWKYFEPEISEILRQITEELDEQRQNESQVSEGK